MDKVHWSTRMEAIVQVEWRVLSGLRWTVVDDELHGGQQSLPARAFLLGVQCTAQHHLYHPIHHLHLTIGLTVVGTGHPQRASQNVP